MSQVLSLEETNQNVKVNHPFLAELIQQIRLTDTLGKYLHWSDETLVKQLIISRPKEATYANNLNFDPLNQLLINAFYHAMGVTIEKITGHTTETFVNLKGKELNSAVISCGGVLVLSALIWGCGSFGFISLQELIESAEANIQFAVTKASHYLDFTY